MVWNVQRLRKQCLFFAAMDVVPLQKFGWRQRFARIVELRSAHGGTAHLGSVVLAFFSLYKSTAVVRVDLSLLSVIIILPYML